MTQIVRTSGGAEEVLVLPKRSVLTKIGEPFTITADEAKLLDGDERFEAARPAPKASKSGDA